jgi:hypothetical protein
LYIYYVLISSWGVNDAVTLSTSFFLNHYMYKVHHAPKGSFGITTHEFKEIEEVIGFIGSIVFPVKLKSDTVYLVEFGEEVIVTENGLLVNEIFNNPPYHSNPMEWSEIAIQEYKSYEEAYAVALSIKEVSHLCYEPVDLN